jgi:hypothetical protein
LNACFCGGRYRYGAARSRASLGIFKFSIYYLGLLFTAAAADVLFDRQLSGVNLYAVATSSLTN